MVVLIGKGFLWMMIRSWWIGGVLTSVKELFFDVVILLLFLGGTLLRLVAICKSAMSFTMGRPEIWRVWKQLDMQAA